MKGMSDLFLSDYILVFEISFFLITPLFLSTVCCLCVCMSSHSFSISTAQSRGQSQDKLECVCVVHMGPPLSMMKDDGREVKER